MRIYSFGSRKIQVCFSVRKITNILGKYIRYRKSTNPPTVEWTRGRFHQHVYAQLLCPQIPKAQKGSQVISVFCTFGICMHKSCSENVGEIDPKSQSCKHLQNYFSFQIRLKFLWYDWSRVPSNNQGQIFFYRINSKEKAKNISLVIMLSRQFAFL